MLEGRDCPATFNWTVNTSADTPDANLADQIPRDANGLVSLRAALDQAGAMPGNAYQIDFTPAVTAAGINLTGPMPLIDNNTVTVANTNLPNRLVITGSPAGGMFRVGPAATAAFQFIEFRGGRNTLGLFGSGLGGAINNRGWLTVAHCTFYDNMADEGGAIAGLGPTSRLTADYCDFLTNWAGLGGVNQRNVGGAIALSDGSTALINWSNIRTNKTVPGAVNGQGGGIAVRTSARLTLTETTLDGNEGSSGGGIYIFGGAAAMTGGTLVGNKARTGDGGGIYQESLGAGATTTRLERVSVTANRAESGKGGGIHVVTDGLTLVGCSVAGNRAVDGAGVYFTGGGTLSIERNPILGTITSFDGNTATNNGGGVYLATGTLTMTQGGTFTSNSAGNNGGGFYIGGGTADFRTVSWDRNAATDAGGGIYAAAGAATLTQCTFNLNTAAVGPKIAKNNGGVTLIMCVGVTVADIIQDPNP
jgi:predicted outer membrane repeat protein